jgi:hypothetical protein
MSDAIARAGSEPRWPRYTMNDAIARAGSEPRWTH